MSRVQGCTATSLNSCSRSMKAYNKEQFVASPPIDGLSWWCSTRRYLNACFSPWDLKNRHNNLISIMRFTTQARDFSSCQSSYSPLEEDGSSVSKYPSVPFDLQPILLGQNRVRGSEKQALLMLQLLQLLHIPPCRYETLANRERWTGRYLLKAKNRSHIY